VRETMLWQADAGGTTPLVVTGAGPLASVRVQLQDPTEASANTGTNGGGNLTGDGIALELDLSAITSSQTLTLINNQTSDAVTGFFERDTTRNLYEEGEVILNAGFDGTVTISYVGGTGNDVVLNLVALLGDYDRNGTVDSADYVVWRKTGINGQQGLNDWRANYGKSAPSFGLPIPGESLAAQVPEPATWITVAIATMIAVFSRQNRSRKNPNA
jgi:hypothetical protein